MANDMSNISSSINDFQTALLEINRIKAREVLENVFDKHNKFEVVEEVIVKALENIGKGWEDGEFSLSQVYMAGSICEKIVDRFLPMDSKNNTLDFNIAICVLQDYHALGKKIVSSTHRASGYNILDFGYGLSVDEVIEKVIKNKTKILLISTLMLPSAMKVREVVEEIRDRNLNTKIIVGGAPFRLDKNLWKSVSADADGINGVIVQGIIDQFIKGGV